MMLSTGKSTFCFFSSLSFHTWFQTAVDICWSAWCYGADNSAQVLAVLSTYDLKAWAQQNHTLHSTVSCYKKTNIQRVKDVLLKLSFVHILNVFLLSVIDNLLSKPNPDKILQCRQMYNRTCSLLEWDSLITVCELWGLQTSALFHNTLYSCQSRVCVCVCSDNPAV